MIGIVRRTSGEPMTGSVPYDAEVEYLRTDHSGQYFNLDIEFDATTDCVEVCFRQITNNVQTRLFSGCSGLQVYVNGSSTFSIACYNGSSTTWKAIFSTQVGTVKRKWVVDYANKNGSVDDIAFSWTDKSIGTGAACLLTSNVANSLIGYLYSARYWKNGTLIRDLIPVRLGTVGYMYDKVNGVMYENKNGNDLILGRDIYPNLNSYIIPDYIMHTGNSGLIDTRFIPNQDTRVITEIWQSPYRTATWQELFTARLSTSSSQYGLDVICADNGGYPRTSYGSKVYDSPAMNVYQRMIVDKNKSVTTITKEEDSTVLWNTTATAATFNSKYYLWYGGKNKGAQTSYSGDYCGNTFGFKIYDNDTLINDFVPAIHPDGTCGFFDTIGKRFWESATNAFSAGNIYTYDTIRNKQCVFFGATAANGSFAHSTTNLLTSFIPIRTDKIKIKSDSNYTTTVVEIDANGGVLHVGGQTVVSNEADGDVLQLDKYCSNIAIMLSDATGLISPDFKVEEAGDIQYLTLTAIDSGTFTFNIGQNVTTSDFEYIEYSVDNGNTWTKTDNVDSTVVSATTPVVTAGNTVLWRGKGNRISVNYTDNNYSYFSSTGSFNASGNIMSILYRDDFGGKTVFPTSASYSFTGLFKASNIISAANLFLAGAQMNGYSYDDLFHSSTITTPPQLIAKKVANYGYSGMFVNCENLVTAPELPATSLGTYCYNGMFKNCTALVNPPTLSVTTLADYCYREMFSGCTSLVTPPSLPAATMKTGCYSYMFADCSSLTSTSTLSSTSLANYCYQYMFRNCTSLTTPPLLPATTLQNYCYNGMFYGCSALTSTSVLSATTAKQYCYSSMFAYCTSLTTPPELPATTLDNYCYQYMFQGCTNLSSAPALSAATMKTYCYRNMFEGCTSLTSAPTLASTSLATYCYDHMFSGCTNLATPPSLPATALQTYCYRNMFQDCTSLTSAPTLEAATVKAFSYAGMFERCTSLVTPPALPATTLDVNCYEYMFNGCTSLTSAPNLPATTLKNYCYHYMFQNCTSLVTAPEIAATTLGTYCCEYMFVGCTFTTAPTLAAATLTQYCYRNMFQNCTSLNYIKMLATTVSASNSRTNWMSGVQTTGGIFVKHIDATWTGTGVSSVPTNWTVIYYDPTEDKYYTDRTKEVECDDHGNVI